MKTILIKLEPCCSTMDGAMKSICAISNFTDNTFDKVRIGLKIDSLVLYHCPWCGKEIDLKVV